MVITYSEIGYNEDYLHSDLIGGIKVDKVTECSLDICLLDYEMSVQNGKPDIITSVIDHGRLFWRKTSDDFVALNQTLCWRPTSGPLDIAIGDPTNETYV